MPHIRLLNPEATIRSFPKAYQGMDAMDRLPGVNMKVGMLWVGLLMGSLLGCKQAAVPAAENEGADVAAPAQDATASAHAEAAGEGEDGESAPYEEGDSDIPTPAGFDYAPSCEENPLATHFFTLVGGNTVDNCGRADAKLTAAFDALLKEAAQYDLADPDAPPQRERLLSGPSAAGAPKTLGAETWWFYTACQAHQCDTHQLAMLYQPDYPKLVGRLVSHCKVSWLGNPTAEQRALIDETKPVDPALLKDDAPCEEAY